MDPDDWLWKVLDTSLGPIPALLPLLLQNFSNLFSVIAKSVVAMIVAAGKLDYYVHQYVLTVSGSLVPMLNQLQQMWIFMRSMAGQLMHHFSKKNL